MTHRLGYILNCKTNHPKVTFLYCLTGHLQILDTVEEVRVREGYCPPGGRVSPGAGAPGRRLTQIAATAPR